MHDRSLTGVEEISLCPRCDYELMELHCRLICIRCGYNKDCSD